jgi:recombination protein RecA
LGSKAGIIEKSGSWFSFENQRIGQGRENAKAFLAENPDMAAKIEALVRANAGLLGAALATAPEKDDDGDDE